ncbi:hypothetical protein CR513_13242, partial [Mucuna pruriens]
NGVVHELTCVNTPQQNGVAKRKNRHLLEVARAIFQMSVPNVYWREAVLTATYLINRLPTREALKDENWVQAMKEEMEALDRSNRCGITINLLSLYPLFEVIIPSTYMMHFGMRLRENVPYHNSIEDFKFRYRTDKD